jgi:putative heme-binding domain-containing protein
MYRFVIEHPRWIPPEDLAKLDTRAGAGLGRIYRVVPADRQCRKWCRFDSSDVSQIVRAMDSPNGWQRDMAMMQLIWRNDKRSIPWLEDILRASSHPEARVSALCTLNALTSLSSKLIQLAMRDRNAGVRFHAVRIASALQHSDANIQTMIVTASSDVDSFVRLQAVYALGGSDSAEGSRCLARLANDCRDDAILSAAIWSGLSIRNLGRFIEEINSRNAPTVDFIERLGTFVSACGTPSHLHSFLEKLSSPNSQFPAAWQVAGVVTINDGISKNGLAGDAVKARLEEMIRNWADKARVQLRTNPNSEVSPWNIRLLGRESGKIQDDVNLIVSMIQPGVSAAMHGLALRECERINSRYVPQRLIAVWDKLAPMTKTQVLSVLLSREDWLTTFLEAVETRRILSSEIPAAIRQRLLSVSNPVYRERASKALNRQATENPDKLIARYESVLRGGGRAERGKDVFARVCSACHALNGVGTSIGPDLAAIGRRDRRTIVQEIVDPNRSVDPRYFEYQIVLKSGRELRGIIESESAAAVSMVASDGKREVIARQDVEDISSLKRSLMPEGLDRDITIYEMADLLAFVESAGRRPKQLVGNLPKTVKAVSGVYRLEAQHAEIYGQDITFEHGFWNIGHWHAESDTVLWKIDIDKHGEYDVYIDYACESRVSGNGLTITFADEKIDWIVKSTGDWSNYAQTRVGSVRIRPGNWELVVFASQPIRGALLDLRSVYLVPKGFALAKLPNAKGDDLTNVLQRLKDPATDNKVRQALIERNVNDSPRLVELLTNDLGGDTAEEYRRIPLIWQISITAAKKNEADVVRRLLDGSLPATRDGRLRDWQAVVIGGGIINGLSIIGEWPANRVGKIIGEHPALKDRLMGAVSQASRLADNETIPTSTRYDLLRMVALDSDDRNLRLLAKYLRKGVHPELQMGAVSGLNDIPSPKVEDLLLQSIQELTGTNRGMAIDALLRSESRMIRLLDAIERDVLPSEWVSDSQRRVMLDSKNTSIAKRASRVLTAKD